MAPIKNATHAMPGNRIAPRAGRGAVLPGMAWVASHPATAEAHFNRLLVTTMVWMAVPEKRERSHPARP